jgi:hypothetical protein
VADVVTTAGDLLYATAADTVTRLGIGTAGQVLAVDSGATAPEWVTPAAGGGAYTSIASGSFSSNAVNITSISGSYTDLYLVIKDLTLNADGELRFRFNNDTNSNRHLRMGETYVAGGAYNTVIDIGTSIALTSDNKDSADNDDQFILRVNNYSVAQKHTGFAESAYINNGDTNQFVWLSIFYTNPVAITEINLTTNQTFSGGTYILYGVK